MKIKTKINYPMILDMTPYCTGYIKNKQNLYELYGVCIHNGDVLGGHYYAFTKNFKNEWICYNDRRYTIIQNLENIITNEAYILFYRKK